jgi:hypothetical protein
MPGRKHEGLPVPGYQPQGDWQIEMVSENKVLEERLLRRIDGFEGKTPGHVDPRWLALARTHIEEGFMCLNRAIFQTRRVALPDDGDDHGGL